MVKEILGAVVSALLTVPGAAVEPHEVVPVMAPVAAVIEEAPQREMRGVWVTTVINLDFPSRPGLSNTEIKREIDYIIQHSRSVGLNAIFLQVRPAGDAIYPSEIFPWSKYLTGEQGLAPAYGFDPLAYWIEQAHANGIELHAWINPYRITHSTSRILDVNLLHPSNPARLRPDLVVPRGNALYLDPGFPDSRALIISGIQELLRNYNLDGIHFDDYFYPGLDFNDSVSFARYGAGRERHAWRVDNVNALVSEVQQAINEIDPSVRFSISPTGIWANIGSHPLGSQTRGYQHYLYLAADTRRWVQEGWVDFIIPQIYWHIGFDIADYEILLRWWEDLVRGTDVNLYIGHAAWREHDNQANFNGEILRQLQMNEQSDVVDGSVFFRWRSLQGTVGYTLRNWYADRPQEIQRPTAAQPPQRQPVVVMNELFVAFPTRDVTVGLDAAGHNVWGSSIPSLPLYMNGQPVSNRTPEGFFSMFVPLQNGENVLEFTQPGLEPVVRRISRTAPAAPPVQPPTDPAPTIPDREFPREEQFYAIVSAQAAWLHPRAATAGGSNWMVEHGMIDRVIATAQNDRWLLLSNGGWIESAHVNRHTPQIITENILHEGRFLPDGNAEPASSWRLPNDHLEIVAWRIAENSLPADARGPAARVVYENGLLTVFFGMQTVPPPLGQPPEDSVFSAVSPGITDEGIPYIVFTVRDGKRLNGYDIIAADNQLKLLTMTPRPLYPNWRTPFNGFTFVIDPGHGGTDVGALGPMGTQLAEKHINLAISIKLADQLRSLGAEVVLLREDNETEISLRERVMTSRAVRPDMFISVHANSVAETTDATNIRGFTVWYRNDISYPLARHVMNHLHAVNPYTNRWPNPNQANLYVCRPTWTPSILLETSFMSNIEDFAWMINPGYQERFTNEMVAAIANYFLPAVDS